MVWGPAPRRISAGQGVCGVLVAGRRRRPVGAPGGAQQVLGPARDRVEGSGRRTASAPAKPAKPPTSPQQFPADNYGVNRRPAYEADLDARWPLLERAACQ